MSMQVRLIQEPGLTEGPHVYEQKCRATTMPRVGRHILSRCVISWHPTDPLSPSGPPSILVFPVRPGPPRLRLRSCQRCPCCALACTFW